MFRVLFILFLIFPTLINAQKETSKWFFGRNAGIDFSSGNPKVLTGGQIYTDEGVASISDPEGGLLFYTEGTTIWNNRHSPMPNGSGLLGHYSSTQSAIIVPVIGDSKRYYVFTVPQLAGRDGFRYSIVNMELNNGLGDIELKNILLQSNICEKVTAVKHCNGRDTWVIVHGFNSANFYAYLITPAGINTTPVVSTTGQFVFGNNGDFTIGYMKASPSGKKIAAAYSLIGADLLDFDNSTGIVSNGERIFLNEEPYWLSQGAYGIEFSPNSKYLYISGDYLNWTNLKQHSYLLQYDVTLSTHTSIQQSKYVVYDDLSGMFSTNFGAIQTGPDGKIYLTEVGKKYLSVINNPNLKGVDCNFNYGAVNIHDEQTGTGYTTWGLPSFIPYYLKSSFSAKGDCKGKLISFEYERADNEISVKWDFGDPSSGIDNFATTDTANHLFSRDGEFIVKLIRFTDCGTDTVSKKVGAGIAEVSLGKDTVICGNNQFTITPTLLGSNNAYLWQDGSSEPIYYATKEGLYWMELTNQVNGCKMRDSMSLSFKPIPALNLGEDIDKCDGETFTLTAPSNGTYLWNNGSTDKLLNISQPGLYWLQITESGCIKRDSIKITYHDYPNVSLGKDTTLCEGTSMVLDALNPGMKYIWQNNSPDQIFQVNGPGKYWVTVNNAGCISSDTINVLYRHKPAFSLGKDTVICEGTTIKLQPHITKGTNLSYTWSTGSSDPSINVKTIGQYLLTVTNECGSSNDQINITRGICKLFVPTAFTPNGDGINDIFKVSYAENLTMFSLSIYNRWGNLLFQTNNILNGWDGRYNGQPQVNDTYIWVIRMKTITDFKEQLLKGTFQLLK